MKFKNLSAILIVLLLLSILGCFGSSVPKITTPPPLKESKKIVVVSFGGTTSDKALSALGSQIAYNLATRLGLMVKEAEWLYDQSANLNPVSQEMKKLNLTYAELLKSPDLASKLGRSMGADLVIVGEIKKPAIKLTTDSKPLKPEARRGGIAGSSRYIRSLQKATADIVVQVIDVKSEKPIFSDQVKGYVRYWYAYQTQQRGQIVFKDKEQIYADLNNHLTRRIIHGFYPTGTPDVPIPEVLLKPTIPLVGTAGAITFD